MIQLTISEGPSFNVNWFSGMTGRQALEAAYNANPAPGDFTYSLQYYGASLGYLVDMINETYDTFISKYEPYFFWEIFVNGTPAQTGIDGIILTDGDTLTFSFQTFSQEKHKNSTLQAKFKLKKLLAYPMN